MIRPHQSVKHHTCCTLNALTAVHGYSSCRRFPLKNRQCFRQAPHGQIDISLILLSEALLLHEPHVIPLLLQTSAHCFQYQLVFLYGIRRELRGAIDQQELPHALRY